MTLRARGGPLKLRYINLSKYPRRPVLAITRPIADMMALVPSRVRVRARARRATVDRSTSSRSAALYAAPTTMSSSLTARSAVAHRRVNATVRVTRDVMCDVVESHRACSSSRATRRRRRRRRRAREWTMRAMRRHRSRSAMRTRGDERMPMCDGARM